METELSDISKAFDQILISSISRGIDRLRVDLEAIRGNLLAQYSGNTVAEIEILRCASERLMVGLVKLGCPWMEGYHVYKQRSELRFDNPVCHYLLLQWLLTPEVGSGNIQEVIERCRKLKEELISTKEGCEQCLRQLDDKVRMLRNL